MGLTNMDAWLAARGLGRAQEGTGAQEMGNSPEDPDDALRAQIETLETEIARQRELILRLQTALRSEIQRSKALERRSAPPPPSNYGGGVRSPPTGRVTRRPRQIPPPPPPASKE
jgi:hypothetical protein